MKKKVAQVVEDDPALSLEHFELLISDEYELTRPIPIRVYRYKDGVVLITSVELNLYAQADSEFDAIQDFSDILIDELEDIESDGMDKLGGMLHIRFSLLKRLIRKIA